MQGTGAAGETAARVLGIVTVLCTGAALLHRRVPAGARQGGAATASGLRTSARLLAGSVLADSAVEHGRSHFANPGMLAPLLSSFALIASGPARRPASYRVAVAVGAVGSTFHLFNVVARPGGLRWQSLFYGAPLGAPAALALAGLLGLASLRVAQAPDDGRALSALVALGLAGASAEAALLHFRGAFQHPAMWLPVSLPPATAALMATQAAGAVRPRALARLGLAITAVLGVAGSLFHARGVQRQMGGWRNWQQNVASGPPLPAPPAFTALALAGLFALDQLAS